MVLIFQMSNQTHRKLDICPRPQVRKWWSQGLD